MVDLHTGKLTWHTKNGGLEHDFLLLIGDWPRFHVNWPGCTLVFQHPPVIPSEEVFRPRILNYTYYILYYILYHNIFFNFDTICMVYLNTLS